MVKRFRVSAIGRIKPGVPYDKVKDAVVAKLAEKGLNASNLRWLTIPSDGGTQLYGKFSTVIPVDELDDTWNLSASRSFSDAGYGDVTWKITPVGCDDPDGESTTCSIPEALVQQWLDEDDADSEARDAAPPDPFGSDQFWEWFEERDD